MSDKITTKAPVDAATFSSANNGAQTWRGQCINVFADIEQQLNSLLAKTQQLPAYSGLKPAFPVPLGLEYKRLRELLTTIEGPLKLSTPTAIARLESFIKFHELRNLLCHGALQVTLAEDQTVYYVFEILGPAGSGPGSSAIRRSDANEMRNTLKSAAKTLKTELIAIEKSF